MDWHFQRGYLRAMDVADYVVAFNAGVETGGWDRCMGFFADDAVMAFEGPPVGPITGREAIRRAYSESPPTDTIELSGAVVEDGDVVVARYRWTATGEPGTMRFVTADELITRLTITFG
jgi:ketosteroid isomerase-like protein